MTAATCPVPPDPDTLLPFGFNWNRVKSRTPRRLGDRQRVIFVNYFRPARKKAFTIRDGNSSTVGPSFESCVFQ